MMGDRLRLGRLAAGLAAENFSGTAMQGLTAALEEALVGGVLDQRVLKTIGRLRAEPSTSSMSASRRRSSAKDSSASSRPL